MLVVLKLIGTSCSCYNNNCKTKVLLISLFIYDYLDTVFILFYRTVVNIIFIILNFNEHFKLIELNPNLNPVKSFIAHCYSDSSVYYQEIII